MPRLGPAPVLPAALVRRVDPARLDLHLTVEATIQRPVGVVHRRRHEVRGRRRRRRRGRSVDLVRSVRHVLRRQLVVGDVEQRLQHLAKFQQLVEFQAVILESVWTLAAHPTRKTATHLIEEYKRIARSLVRETLALK